MSFNISFELTSASWVGGGTFTELLLRCWKGSRGFLSTGSAFATMVALIAAIDVFRMMGGGARGSSNVSAAGEGGLYAGLANTPASPGERLHNMQACLHT